MRDILAPGALWRQVSGWLRSPRRTWIEPGRIIACRYPRDETDLDYLARRGVRVLLNLHEDANDPARLRAFGLREVHVPVRDFTAPAPAQIVLGVATITEALGAGEGVAVHCGAGLGRSGTMLACYYVSTGQSAEDAIRRVRHLRPGSIETERQHAAVRAYAASLQAGG